MPNKRYANSKCLESYEILHITYLSALTKSKRGKVANSYLESALPTIHTVKQIHENPYTQASRVHTLPSFASFYPQILLIAANIILDTKRN